MNSHKISRKVIDWFKSVFCCKKQKIRLQVKFGWFEQNFNKGLNIVYTLRSDYKVPITIAGVDAAGNPAPLETIVVTSSDEGMLLVEADATTPGLFWVVPVGPTGISQVRVSADAKIGPEVLELTALWDVEIIPGEAVTLQVMAGEAIARK